MNEPIGPVGVAEPGAAAAHRCRHRGDGVVLSDHALVQALLDVQELLGLPLEHAADRDAGPARHHGGDVVLVDLLLEEGAVTRDLAETLLLGGERALQLGERAVAQLGGATEVGGQLGALGVVAHLLDALLDVADGADGALLLLPALAQLLGALLEVGEVTLQRGEALPRGGVRLLAQSLALDLELADVAFHRVQLRRHRVDLDAQLGGGLVDEVDRLVWKEAIADVPVREHRGGDDGGVLDAHTVVHLVALLETAQDADGVFDAGLVDDDRLEAPLQRGVLLDVLAVLVEGGGADAAQLAARQRRLEHVAGVHRPLGGARAHQGVELVDEEDDPAVRAGDLVEHGLEPVLELAAVLGAGDHGAEVQRHHAAVAQALGHVAGGDPLCQPLGDGGLADSRLADQHGVVLGAPAQHLDHPADLLVATDDRVELARAGGVGEVAAVLVERVVLVLGVGVGDALRAAHRCQRGVDAVGGDAGAAEQPIRLAALAAGQREEEVLGGDVLVLESRHLVEGGHEHVAQRVTDSGLAATELLGPSVELALQARRQRLRRNLEALQQGGHQPLLLAQEREKKMLGLDPGVLHGGSGLLSGLQGFLGSFREAIEAHGGVIPPIGRAINPQRRSGRRRWARRRSWRTMRLVAMPFVPRRPSTLAVLVVVATICTLALVGGRAGPSVSLRARAATNTAADLPRSGLVRDAAGDRAGAFLAGRHAAGRPGGERTRWHPRRHRLQHASCGSRTRTSSCRRRAPPRCSPPWSALENLQPSQPVTVTPDAVHLAWDESRMGLAAGQTLTVRSC